MEHCPKSSKTIIMLKERGGERSAVGREGEEMARPMESVPVHAC